MSLPYKPIITILSASYAVNASYSKTAATASYLIGANPQISCSYAKTAAIAILSTSASLAIQAISANTALSSSWAFQSQTASHLSIENNGSTPPLNPNAVVLWIPVTVNGVVFKMPLYL